MEKFTQFRFDSFVECESSSFAFAAAKAFAEDISVGNPLVIIGDAGLGKTHLLHAIENDLRKRNPAIKIRGTTANEFSSEFVQNIKSKQENADAMDDMFRKYCVQTDILLMDDFQFIEGKTKSQQELLQIFNSLLLANKPVVVASQVPISSIEKLNESLRSRLMGGLTVSISSPTYKDRLAILRKKFKMIHLNVSEEVLDYLSEKVSGSVRDLEGIVSNLSFRVRQSNKDIDPAMAAEILAEHIQNSYRGITAESIIKAVSEHYGITIEILKMPGRGSKEACFARQIAMYLIRNSIKQSYTAIGKLFKRNHATALHAYNLVEKKIKTEPVFNLEIKNIKRAL